MSHSRAGFSVCFWLLAVTIPGIALAQEHPLVDAGEPFGMLPLIDEVIVGASEDTHGFVESEPGISVVQDVLGRPTRIIPNEGGARFIGYRLGADADLEAGQAYVLSVDFPEDAPRTLYVVNRGAEYGRGFSTGSAIGDVWQTYTYQNHESLAYPLSGQHESWKTMFFLHERYPGQTWAPQGPMARPETPEDGFMVYIAQPGIWSRGGQRPQAPRSAGSAISRIRLFAVPDPDALTAPINYPPEDLPRRHLFWREEMSDGAVHARSNQAAVDNETDWFEYKARLMQFLGMNTYSKDLLEFGANQGWDSTIHGGNNWVHQSDSPQRWSNMLEMLGRYDFYVLPMYEYAGSKGDNGLGYQRRARPLRRDPLDDEEDATCPGYTHIWWAERANVDVADPETYEDLRKILDATIIRHKDRVNFLGAWLRTRNSSIPVSFSDFSLNLFSEQTSQAMPVTRAMLIDDAELKEAYVDWWYAQRKALLARTRDLLHEELGLDSVLLFTAYHEEPGPGINGGAPVTDDVAGWSAEGFNPLSFDEIASGGRYLEQILTPLGSWDSGCMDPVKRRYEWNHSAPRPDPENTGDLDGFLFTYPFNRLYSVTDPTGFEAFRGPAGLAMIRHYSLNESTMDVAQEGGEQASILGYFVTDVDRAGPYSVLAEARALAMGDPRFIGYLSSQSYNRGFPEYVRRFNTAFLSLPAVESALLPGAASQEDVKIRRYPTDEHGIWFAIINTGMNAVDAVTINLPDEGSTVDAVTNEALTLTDSTWTVDLYPGEVRTIHVSAAVSDPQNDSDSGVGSEPDVSDSGPPLNPDADSGLGPAPTDATNESNSAEAGCDCSANESSGLPIWLALVLLYPCVVRRRP